MQQLVSEWQPLIMKHSLPLNKRCRCVPSNGLKIDSSCSQQQRLRISDDDVKFINYKVVWIHAGFFHGSCK